MQSRRQRLLSLAVLLAGAGAGTESSSAAAAFAPVARSIRKSPSSARTRPLSVVAVDPSDTIRHVGAAADAMHGAAAAAGAAEAGWHLEHAFTSLTTAAADAAVLGKKYAWEFMGLHGERISPCGGGSCPPGFGLDAAASSVSAFPPGMDYFLPDDPSKAAAAIEAQRAAREAGSAMPSIGTIRDALPGGRPEVLPFPAADPALMSAPIEQDELEMMLREADIASRIPMVAFAMVMIDFFFFNSGNDVYREDVVEESSGRAAEWLVAAGTRVGVGIVLALATIAFSNTFYHPI